MLSKSGDMAGCREMTQRLEVDRRPLAKIILFRANHVGNTWFMVYLKDI